MRQLLSAIVLIIMTSCYSTTTRNDAEINFDKKEIDFGEINYKQENVGCSFEFVNPGKSPIVIQDVKTSCGCTVPDWQKKPIKPGKTGEVNINYDTSHPGMFRKTITVFYNGKDSPVELIIKGSVKYPEEGKSIEINQR